MAYQNVRFACGNLPKQPFTFSDVEEDCAGPSVGEDDVDGCMLLRQDLCVPAHSPAKGFNPGMEMISRGSHSFKNNSSTIRRGLFEDEHPMVIPFEGIATMHKIQTAFPTQAVGETKNTCDSICDSGVSEDCRLLSEEYSTNLETAIHSPQPNNLTSQLENLKIGEGKSIVHSDDEAYYSEERTCSVDCLPSVVDDNKTELLFLEQDKEGDTQPHLLLIHNKISKFLTMLSCVNNPAYLNIQNFLMQTLLHISVILNLPEVVRKLVAWGADVDLRDRHGNTPLHIACERGYYDCVIALTTPLDPREVKDVPYKTAYQRIPQDQDLKNYHGMTCLHLAAYNDHINIVNHLITMCYADINVQEGRGGETILHQAVERSCVDLVKYLLLHRELNLEASRYDGTTALHMAKGYGNTRMINFLVNAGADNHYNPSTSDSEDDLMVDGNDEEELPYDDFKIGGSSITA